ncbi:serine hydrolase domain-containing protein [Roseateles sp. LKC17W]|uniref:Serine hydrolase domain-containing protein n=1 Tax=Pelomonas margarita TaxID=3299031 RepID=A0ABW7FMW1_9BURK
MSVRPWVTAVGLVLLATAAIAEPLVKPARVDEALRGLVQRGELVGVAALVYERGREAYFGAFGQSDREAGRAMSRDALMQIYSMTKPVTGVALMQLYEQGRFQLDDPVAKYLPEFANPRVWVGEGVDGQPLTEAAARAITIRDLGRNTAGFAPSFGLPPAMARFYEQHYAGTGFQSTLAELVARIASAPLVDHPGRRWTYDRAMNVQARLVETLSGQRFEDYLREHLFKPMGMASTRFHVAPDAADRPRFAATYSRQPDGSLRRIPDAEAHAYNDTDWALKTGTFGLVSTLDDYMRFARMLLDGGVAPNGARVLKAQTVQLMATDVLPAELSDRSWLPSKGNVGFGINVGVRVGPPRHAGDVSGAQGEFFWDGAANTLFWVDPRHDIAAVLFTQFFPPGDARLNQIFRESVYADDPQASAGSKPRP